MAQPAARPLPLAVIAALAALAFTALHVAGPLIDPIASGAFYTAADGFFWRDAGPVRFVYLGTRWLTIAVVLALLGVIIHAARDPARRLTRNRAALALAALAIGPGIVINPVLKDHWGRPRPSQIVDYGGSGHYVAPGAISDQCRRNCSFVSSHAGAGFFWITGAWLFPAQRRRWLIGGYALGGLIGLGRIIQGGHFVSDVLGAALVVTLCNVLMFRLARRRGWLDSST